MSSELLSGRWQAAPYPLAARFSSACEDRDACHRFVIEYIEQLAVLLNLIWMEDIKKWRK